MGEPKVVTRSGSGYVLHLGQGRAGARRPPGRRAAGGDDRARGPGRGGAAVPRRPPRPARRRGGVPAADARRAGHQPAGRHRHRRGRAGASGRKVPLDEAEMLAFVQAVNSVRLVLGTVLDVGEDDESGRWTTTSPSTTRPSTTCTPTCRGCSTRRSGRCRATCRRDRSRDAPRGSGGRCCYCLGALNWMRRLPPSSSGLGHHPFKVAARVRIPLGVRYTNATGPVVKSGVHAGLSSRRSRVQVPSGPLHAPSDRRVCCMWRQSPPSNGRAPARHSTVE